MMQDYHVSATTWPILCYYFNPSYFCGAKLSIIIDFYKSKFKIRSTVISYIGCKDDPAVEWGTRIVCDVRTEADCRIRALWGRSVEMWMESYCLYGLRLVTDFFSFAFSGSVS